MEEWVIVFKNRIVQRFTIDEGQSLTIGRGRKADVIINNNAMSREHATLELRDGTYYLADLHSMNGTWVDGKKIVSAVPVKKNCLLELGKFTLKPAQLLTNEIEAGSVAVETAAQDDHNHTLYLSGIFKEVEEIKEEKTIQKSRMLSVLEGTATPSRLSLKGKSIVKAGTDPKSDLVLSGLLLAKTQFTVSLRKKFYVISPEGGGLRKTMVNGKKISGAQKLKALDIIQAGGVKIRFS